MQLHQLVRLTVSTQSWTVGLTFQQLRSAEDSFVVSWRDPFNMCGQSAWSIRRFACLAASHSVASVHPASTLSPGRARGRATMFKLAALIQKFGTVCLKQLCNFPGLNLFGFTLRSLQALVIQAACTARKLKAVHSKLWNSNFESFRSLSKRLICISCRNVALSPDRGTSEVI